MPRPSRSEDVLTAALTELRATRSGHEASMYGFIRDILIDLGHPANQIFLDDRNSAGGRPDVSANGKDGPTVLQAWLVIEAKDEPGSFDGERSSTRIFKEKWRYVTQDTEWFVGIDPTHIRIRRVLHIETPDQPEEDQVLRLTQVEQIRRALEPLSIRGLAEKRRLKDFRDGRERSFARIDATSASGSRLFLASLESASHELAAGVRAALDELDAPRQAIRGCLNEIKERFPGVTVISTAGSLRTRGNRDLHRDDVAAFRAIMGRLRDAARRSPSALTIEMNLWSSYIERTQKHNGDPSPEEAAGLLVQETSAMVLSRILLLRFFEDYGYFGRRYLCNGGVNAFQLMIERLGQRYPSLLKTAYAAGTDLYPSVFELSPLDWVLESKNDAFSMRLERSMMLIAVFNFKTIKEELLSRLYGHFFDEAQRKRRGEHYTPPSIARWLVRRAMPPRTAPRLLDPACGFGTFLVGGWQETIGRALHRGAMTEVEAENALANICGNDLNYFSAAMSQMQLLWTVVQSRSDGRRREPLPPLSISAGADAMMVQNMHDAVMEDEEALTTWSDLSAGQYPLVVANPPWVRTERREPLTQDQRVYFEPITEKANLFAMFLYRSMRQWVQPGGRGGFVIPISFLDNETLDALRKHFRPHPHGYGHWTILEIVDFEVVKRAMFPDANVRPIIVIAENRPPTPEDRVTLRIFSHEHLALHEDGEIAEFKVDDAPTRQAAYADVFAPDGRILLRATAERSPLLQRFRALSKWSSIVLKVWELRSGRGAIVSRHLERDDDNTPEGHRWEQADMIGYGMQSGRAGAGGAGEMPVYKGENILPCQLTGDAAEHGVPASYVKPSIWRDPAVLPEYAYAFSELTQMPVGVRFNPRLIAFRNSAVMFVPDSRVRDVPLDFLTQSVLFRWYFLIGLREGVAADYYCHVYPRTVANFPWHEGLISRAANLNRLRDRWIAACEQRYNAQDALLAELRSTDSETIIQRLAHQESLIVRWSGSNEEGFERVARGREVFDVLSVNDRKTAEDLRRVISLFPDATLSEDDIRVLPLPRGDGAAHAAIISRMAGRDLQAEADAHIASLDAIVAEVFGFTAAEVETMRQDLASDLLFQRLQRRQPHQQKTIRGLMDNLARPGRYS